MLKTHDLKSVVCEIESALVSVSYFYTREKNDANGNPRYRVYILDPDAPAVYERIFKCYDLAGAVKNYVENYLREDM